MAFFLCRLLLSSRVGRVFSMLYLIALHVFFFYLLSQSMMFSVSKKLPTPAIVADS